MAFLRGDISLQSCAVLAAALLCGFFTLTGCSEDPLILINSSEGTVSAASSESSVSSSVSTASSESSVSSSVSSAGGGISASSSVSSTGSSISVSSGSVSSAGGGISVSSGSVSSADGSAFSLHIGIEDVDIEMALIDRGTFTMGSPAGEPGRNNFGTMELQHMVTLTKNFYMGKYEVTQEQYAAVMGANPSSFVTAVTGEERWKRPVERVSWYNALIFCNTVSIFQGLTPVYTINGSTEPAAWGAVPASSNETWNAVEANWDANGYRLPTEAEWEYACRAETTTAFHCGTSTPGTITEYAALVETLGWYRDNSESRTHEVGKKAANDWGLYDMHGNVLEWCWDGYLPYSDDMQIDPRESEGSSWQRVRRGGSWNHTAQDLRSAYRPSGVLPSWTNAETGFRVARFL